MLSVYVREQKPYKRRELEQLLALAGDGFVSFAERLRADGILRLVPAAVGETELSGPGEDLPEAFSEAAPPGEGIYVVLSKVS